MIFDRFILKVLVLLVNWIYQDWRLKYCRNVAILHFFGEKNLFYSTIFEIHWFQLYMYLMLISIWSVWVFFWTGYIFWSDTWGNLQLWPPKHAPSGSIHWQNHCHQPTSVLPRTCLWCLLQGKVLTLGIKTMQPFYCIFFILVTKIFLWQK